jgi:hypothetical protein
MDTLTGLICAVPVCLPLSDTPAFLVSLKLAAAVAEVTMEKAECERVTELIRTDSELMRELRIPQASCFSLAKDVTPAAVALYRERLPSVAGGRAPSQKSVLRDARFLPACEALSAAQYHPPFAVKSKEEIASCLLLRRQKKKVCTPGGRAIFGQAYPASLVDYPAIFRISSALGIAQPNAASSAAVTLAGHVVFGWKVLSLLNYPVRDGIGTELPPQVNLYLFRREGDGISVPLPPVDPSSHIRKMAPGAQLCLRVACGADCGASSSSDFASSYPAEARLLLGYLGRVLVGGDGERKRDLESFVDSLASLRVLAGAGA